MGSFCMALWIDVPTYVGDGDLLTFLLTFPLFYEDLLEGRGGGEEKLEIRNLTHS